MDPNEEANTEVENEEIEQEESQDEETQETDESEDDQEDGPLTVTIGDDEPDEDESALFTDKEGDTETMKQVRDAGKAKAKALKAANKELEELKAKEVERAAAKELKELKPKPNFDDYDHGDEEKYADDVLAWKEEEKQHNDKTAKAKEKDEAIQNSYNDNLNNYNTRKVALEVDDYDDVETKVGKKLTETQMQIAVHGLNKPELFFLALSTNSKELDRLADITDPTKYAVAIGKIEATMKASKGRKLPKPETRPKGKAIIESSDKTLERLEKKAEDSGDRTEINRYKKSLRKSA